MITPGLPLGIAQLQHGVDRAAKLERADFLKVFTLEEDRTAAARIESPARSRPACDAPRGDPLGRPPHIFHADRNGGGLRVVGLHSRSPAGGNGTGGNRASVRSESQ